MPARLRKGDTVAVISGEDAGKRGRVLRVIPDKSRVIVEGVNLVYKHLRRSQQNPQGGRVRREAPIPASKVMPVDPQTDKPTRVSSQEQDGRRIRVGRRSQAPIEVTRKEPRGAKGATKEKGAAAGKGAKGGDQGSKE
jgi:large subunit ribosomal protein L24